MQVVDQARRTQIGSHEDDNIPILRRGRTQVHALAHLQVIHAQPGGFDLRDLLGTQLGEILLTAFYSR